MVAVVAALLACLGAAALLTPRLDLVHATLYDACAFRAYQFHWQNHRRQPEPLRYDFTNSPDSVVFVAVWIADGPALNISRALPFACGSPYNRRP
jgi:hypothetical protein